MWRSMLFLAALLLCLAGSGPAQETKKKPLPPALAEMLKGTPEEFIKRFDKNGDKVLDKDEVPPFIAKAFDKADQNSDGKLDQREVADMLRVMRGMVPSTTPPANVEKFIDTLLTQFDADKDGKIARAEAKGRLADNFDMNDTNKDGFLDRAELRTLAQRVLPLLKGGPPGGKFEAKDQGPDFDALDKNADGRLSRAELTGTPWLARFAEIDADNSGNIDRREFEAFLKKQAAK